MPGDPRAVSGGGGASDQDHEEKRQSWSTAPFFLQEHILLGEGGVQIPHIVWGLIAGAP